MTQFFLRDRLLSLVLCVLAGLSVFCGCTKPNSKEDADERVYRIIDRKWQDGFGEKVNYRISDVAGSPNDIEVARAVPDSGVVSLPEAVALATAHNREYQTQKEALYIKALDLRLARHEFESQFFGLGSGRYESDWNDEVAVAEGSVGFNRLLASGMRISTSVGSAWVDVLTGNLRSGLATVLSVAVTQPLLRGSDERVVRENLTQAERDALYEIRSFNRFRKTFVVSVISQYYGVLQSFDLAGNAAANYGALVKLYDKVEKLADAGRIEVFELGRIRQEKLQALDIYIEAQKEYEQSLDEFKITLSLPVDGEFQLEDRELEGLKGAIKGASEFSEAEAVETALAGRLDIANSADAVGDAERKVFVAADGLGAELNLVGGASATSGRRGDRAALRPLREEYELGLELDLPFDRVAEQAVYRKALIALNQRQREYELAVDTATLEVRQTYRDMMESAERYKIQLENLDLARERHKDTFLLVQYGRASTRRVLNAQDDLFDAQNAATEALVDYAIATLNFYRDTGVLQVRPDGMWAVSSN